MTLLQAYLWAASIVSVWGFLRMPRKLGAIDHVGGSVVAGVAFGWFVWPFLLWALARRGRLTLVAIIFLLAFAGTAHALTPRERQLTLHAKTQLDEAIAHDEERTKEIDGAKQETADALDIARLAAVSAQTAGFK